MSLHFLLEDGLAGPKFVFGHILLGVEGSEGQVDGLLQVERPEEHTRVQVDVFD